MSVVDGVVEVAVGVTVEDLRSAFVHAPAGIAVLTPTGVVTGGNPALAHILGRELTELMGDTLFPYTHPDDVPAARASCAAMAAGSVTVVREDCRFVRPDATVVWVRVSTSRVETRGGRSAHLIMHVEDISERKALEARLLHQALHDPLTGVGNRALLRQRVTTDLTHPGPARPGLAQGVGDDGGNGDGTPRVWGLVVLDLDGFKALNDAYGHPAGDAVLIEVAHRVQAQLGPADLVVRLGGDEFAVWCPDTTPTEVVDLVDELRTALRAPCRVDGVVVHLSASIGSATTTLLPGPHLSDPDSMAMVGALTGLFRAADATMYTDKHRVARPVLGWSRSGGVVGGAAGG